MYKCIIISVVFASCQIWPNFVISLYLTLDMSLLRYKIIHWSLGVKTSDKVNFFKEKLCRLLRHIFVYLVRH